MPGRSTRRTTRPANAGITFTRRAVAKGLAFAGASMAVPALAQKAEGPVRIGYAIARTGPWAAGAQVSQEPNYLLWAEQVNAAGGLIVKGTKRPDRADRLRRPQRHRDLRAHLREADGQRQGRPDPAALGHQRQLRGRAAGQPLRLPAARADRAVAQADRHEPAVLLLAAAAARQDDGRAGRHAGGQRREDDRHHLHGRPVRRWRTSPR